MIRLVLAAAVSLIGVQMFRVFAPDFTERRQRPGLNWIPSLRPLSEPPSVSSPTAFQSRFSFEKWVLLVFLLLGVVQITYARPLNFWHDYNPKQFPLGAGTFQYLYGLYTTQFAEITRPYLFPYSFYILALWYCIALFTLLLLIRSVVADLLEYRRQVALLRLPPIPDAEADLQNYVETYERRSLSAFDFVDTVAKCYGFFFLSVIVIGYLEQNLLSCSVLQGAADLGKTLLLTLSLSSLVIITLSYLRSYYIIRTRSLASVSEIGDALEAHAQLHAQLHAANQLAETVRAKDGLRTLAGLFTGTGVIAVVFSFFWNSVMNHDFCGVANALFPGRLVQYISTLFQLKNCHPPVNSDRSA
jgi:hypothetical protein